MAYKPNAVFSIFLKLLLSASQSGQQHSDGNWLNKVPGAIPLFVSPATSSYMEKQLLHW